MKRILTIEPNSALIYYFIIPFVAAIILLIGAIQLDSIFFFVAFFGSLVLMLIIKIIWQLTLGIISYNLLPKQQYRPVKFVLFIITSFINMLIIPLLFIFVIFILDKNQSLVFGLIFILFYGILSNYFQWDFIAKNLSIIKYKNLKLRRLWPLSLVSIGYFPMTAIKTQRVINELMKIKPMPNKT